MLFWTAFRDASLNEETIMMAANLSCSSIIWTAFLMVAIGSGSFGRERPAIPKRDNPSASTQQTAKPPTNSPSSPESLQAEYARLAQLLNTGDKWGKDEAAKTLLLVNPKDVADPEVRKLIARG